MIQQVYCLWDDTSSHLIGVFLDAKTAVAAAERVSLDPECDDFEIGMTRMVVGQVDFAGGVEVDPFTGLNVRETRAEITEVASRS